MKIKNMSKWTNTRNNFQCPNTPRIITMRINGKSVCGFIFPEGTYSDNKLMLAPVRRNVDKTHLIYLCMLPLTPPAIISAAKPMGNAVNPRIDPQPDHQIPARKMSCLCSPKMPISRNANESIKSSANDIKKPRYNLLYDFIVLATVVMLAIFVTLSLVNFYSLYSVVSDER